MGPPVDNLGGILAVADWLSRTAVAEGRPPLAMRQVLNAMIKAHEIQGCMALENAFNKVGIDHVVLVKLATTAVVGQLLGLSRDELVNALSLVFCDGQALRTYRHAPNAGSRKSWAAGDATSRGVRLALMARVGEMGYPAVLSTKTWGFYDASFRGGVFKFQRPYGSYVMENVLFKISYPAEFHAQTAVEAAMQIHRQLRAAGRSSDDIRDVTIRTHEAPCASSTSMARLHNPADRDHTMQYMVAIPLIFGRLTAADYEDDVAADPRVDALRATIRCIEDPAFTQAYHAPGQRAIPNALRVTLNDGTVLDDLQVDYPIGHRRRRAEGTPLLVEKFRSHLALRFAAKQQQAILDASLDAARLDAMAVHDYVGLYV